MKISTVSKASDSNLYTKKELIAWIYEVTNNRVQNIEQLSNGVVFCQLLDVFSDGKIRKQKINLSAKLQHQNLANLKILSTSMLAMGIDKKFDAERISQKKTQDILQLIQWFRKYFIVNYSYIQSARKRKGSLSVQIKLPTQGLNNQEKIFASCSSRKNEPLDLVSREQLQHCFVVNKEIKRVLSSDVGHRSAEKKLDLIKSILFGNKQQKQSQSEKKQQYNHEDLNHMLQTNEIKLQDYQQGLSNQSKVDVLQTTSDGLPS